MIEVILNSLEKITSSLTTLDEKLGFRKILKYSVFALVVFALFNFRDVVKSSVEFIQELNEEMHNDKMARRDQLLAELYPALVDIRSAAKADRLLYFEYHNSKENLVGIPFKYIDLVMQSTEYGLHVIPESTLHDINVGNITTLYDHLRKEPNDVLFCYGSGDENFISKYPGAEEMFGPSVIGNSHCLAFVSIPGIKQPIGLIVLQWIEDKEGNVSINETEVEKIANKDIPRINALILSKR